jgi:endo-1,4-beta-xylanase
MLRSHGRSFLALLSIFCFVMILGLSHALAAGIVSTDFEDGTAQGWIPRGPVTLTNSTTVANTGTHSLLTTGRTAGFNGPSINLTSALTPSQLYIFKVAVRMQAGQAADTLKMTMQSTIGGSNAFATVATSATNAVTDAGWVTLTGTFTPASTATALLLYVEGASATSSYYIDSFDISASNGGCSVPPDNSGFASDFEDNTKQGWGSRIGVEAANVTTVDAHSGTHSLLVTGRTANFQGPAHDATGKMCNGSQYAVIVWVKMAPDQPTTQIRLSVQLNLAGSASFKTVVNNTNVTSGAWVRLKVKPYTFAGAYDSMSIYVESNNNPTASFYIDDFSLQFLPAPVIEPLTSVKEAYANDFLIGFAALPQDITGPHGQLAALHHNSVTPGNALKWDATEPTEGSFNFTTADSILSFAQANNIKMRGHTFVWHSQVPAWVFQKNGVTMTTYSPENKQLVLDRMRNHINALVNHYRDNLYVWDVVNEAVDDSGNYRQSPWYNITVDPNNNPGYPEYMDDAFIYARQALDNLGIGRDKVKLCYNDYNTTIGNKRAKIYEHVSGAIQRGVPIDCVGHQFHNTISFPIDDQGSASSKQTVIDTINLFAGLMSTAGKPIVNQVTEFDINIYNFGQCPPNQTFYFDYDDIVANAQNLLIKEGYRYRDYFQLFRSMHDKIDSVTIWGLGDDDSWLNPGNFSGCGFSSANAPVLFDTNLQHKFAYTGIMSPLDLPGADLETTISADPSDVLSGHTLTYTITAKNNGHNDAANVVLTDSLPAGTVFQSVVKPGNWTCTTPTAGSTGDVKCTAASLGNGAAAQFTLTVLVACGTADGASITNTASVASDTLDPNTAPNNAASVKVNVSNPPPVISGLSADPSLLWSPNHKMNDVTLSYQVSDNCDPTIIPTLAIASSDASNGTGDGNTTNDTQVVDATHVRLRAERSANTGADRVYTITLKATDSQGYSTSNAVTVTVPHSAAQ